MIKGILFDFDGTLANTIDLIVAAFEYSCQEVLGFKPPREQIINTIGLPLAQALVDLTGRPDKLEALRAAYGLFNREHHDAMIKPIPGVAELLAELKKRGLRLAVVTSKKPPMLQRGLDCLKLAPYIDAAVTVLDTEVGKPHPAPTLLGCARLGLAPQECVCVGDSPYDMQSGNAAGVVTVAVGYTSFALEKVIAEGSPDFVIGAPEDLLNIIDKLDKGLEVKNKDA